MMINLSFNPQLQSLTLRKNLISQWAENQIPTTHCDIIVHQPNTVPTGRERERERERERGMHVSRNPRGNKVSVASYPLILNRGGPIKVIHSPSHGLFAWQVETDKMILMMKADSILYFLAHGHKQLHMLIFVLVIILCIVTKSRKHTMCTVVAANLQPPRINFQWYETNQVRTQSELVVYTPHDSLRTQSQKN